MNPSADPHPLVSIVMLSYNRSADVLYGLNRLQEITYPALEFLVVDNASSDDTVRKVGDQFPHVSLISLKENIGVAAANMGFGAAKGEYIVIIDDDSFPLPDSISLMVKRFQEDERIGILAFNVRNVSHFNPGFATEYAARKTPYGLGFNGAGAGLRRSMIEKVGGYSEAFFLYWNEMDLALRCLHAGFKVCWDDRIIALHKYSPQNRSSLRAPFYYTRNLYWLYWQYWPLDMLLTRTVRFAFSCIYHSIEQRSPVYFKAFLSALIHLGKVARVPMPRKLVNSVRLTEKLAFIYFR